VTTSLPEFTAELRRSRPTAPPAVRERVREIAARREERTRRLTWRRSLIVLVPAVLAVVVGGVIFSRDDQRNTAVQGGAAEKSTALTQRAAPKTFGTATVPTSTSGSAGAALDAAKLPPSRTRLQDYDASLALRVKNANALSDASKRALAIARSLGGFASVVSVNVAKGEGDATIRLRVPIPNVQRAIERLSSLGTITGESVQIRDLTAGVNALDRRIARLQKQLRSLRAQKRAAEVERRIASLTAQVERLQRSRSNTVRVARLATIDLAMTTREDAKPPKKDEPGPLHGALVALAWLGIGALYALIVGGPLVLVAALGWLAWRVVRRRREERLLSESG
jgi:uncharacterized small protein (DUF1192 family)